MSLEADSIKFVLFDHSNSSQNVLSIWQAAAKSQPSGFQQSQQPGSPSLASGQIGSMNAVIACQPGRTELAFTALSQPGPSHDTISDVASATKRAATAFKRLLSAYRATRLGIVVDLSEVALDEQSATSRVKAELPFLSGIVNGKDISFQLNSIKQSAKVSGVVINRLCRWAALEKQTFQFQLMPGTQNSSPLSVSSAPVFSAVYDINTAIRPGLFSPTHAKALTDELVSEFLGLYGSGYAYLS